MISTSTHTKWMKYKWIKMQCRETKGSSISTYIITSYFTPPLALMDTNLLNTCIITSYFIHITCISSLLISLPLWHQGQKDYSLSFCWMAFEIFESCLNGINFLHFQLIQECYPCPTYLSMILDLSMMIKRYDNMERYIW
jgi:hypothetical protein